MLKYRDDTLDGARHRWSRRRVAHAANAHAEEAARATRGRAPDDKRWQAVAPGRVES